MKKYGRHYLRRCLSVLLAVAMVCAAAQTLVFAVDVTDDPVTPGWNKGAARARYTTSGTLEITFPESTKPGAEYYAQFYDLDGENRESPVGETAELKTSRTTYADGTPLVSATLGRDWVESSGLNMSHRISVAITAVKDGWRSEAIEALVGESLDVPDADYSPAGSDLYASLARFEDGYNSGLEDEDADNPAPSWRYDRGTDEKGSVDVNGVYVPNSEDSYKYPGFDSSQAFRLYLNGEDLAAGDEERLDIKYQQDHFRFTDATDLWIWVDTTYVEFDKFAIQVHYMDYTGEAEWWLSQDVNWGSEPENNIYKRYSTDVYSTIGYAKRNNNAVPVYYLNDEGLWDVQYTNTEGYLEDFGHYRGFLRVPVEYLQNENQEEREYVDLMQERPYTFNIKGIYNDWGKKPIGTFSAKDAWNELNTDGSVAWWDNRNESDRTDGNAQMDWNYFFNHHFGKDEDAIHSFGVVPIEDIASVGITWSGIKEGSQNKSFYIDQIGFSGAGMTTNDAEKTDNPLQSLDDYAMVPDNQAAVNNLVAKYLPEDSTAVTVADASVIEDLETICDRLKLEHPNELKQARRSLDSQLNGADIVGYVHRQLNDPNADIASLYEIYQSFTLGQIHQLGLKDEAKLIEAYNTATLSEWYPGELGDMYYAPFNDFESNYEIGQTALNEYDDYVEGGLDYFRFAHIVDWDGKVDRHKGAWENKENLVAYAWKDYGNSEDGLGQRFGYGASTIAQNGFDNSKSVNTDIYRDPIDSDVENYRISVTYQGKTADDYEQLEGHSFAGADSFVFYADFTNMSNIRKAWVTIRTEDGEVYSHDDGVTGMLTYQFFNLDNPDDKWQSIESKDKEDGCMSGELCGKRGFFKISLGTFGQMGNGSKKLGTSETIKQVKFFVSSNPSGNKRLNDSFTVDMFGFAADNATSGFEQLKDSSTPVSAPSYTQTDENAVLDRLDSLFQQATDLNGNELWLFDYSSAEYTSMLEEYQTLTVEEKQSVNDQISETYDFTVDQLQLFVKNYDEWGSLGTGQLQWNANRADDLRNKVTTAFNSSLALDEDTPGQIDAIFAAFDQYPDYYANSVQTYWPDRNLHAVFPNYNPKDVVDSSPTVELKYDASTDSYIGTYDFKYVGAIGSRTDTEMSFTCVPENLELTLGDKKVPVTVEGITNGTAVVNGNQAPEITFTVDANDIKKAGEYTGELTIGVSTLPDSTNDNIVNPDQYRSSFKLKLKLVSNAEFTVVIPADVQIPWGENTHTMDDLCMEDCFLPSDAHVDVSVDSNNSSCMRYGDASIPYKLLSGEEEFKKHQFTDVDKVPLSVNVTNDAWSEAPVISDKYEDTLTFTVSYQEVE